MSQYLIIFLIVAVFRGVVWVVQKVQQNAKAREALMAQQASAQIASAPEAVQGVRGRATRAAMGAPVAPSTGPTAAPVRAPTSDSARATRTPKRGQVRTADRGAVKMTRGGVVTRTATRSPAPTVQVQRSLPTIVPTSRAEVREARVGKSSRDVRNLLRDRGSLRQVLLAREILGPPRGMIA